MVKQVIIVNDLNVAFAKKLLYGKDHITKRTKKNIGSIFGLKKLIRFANYVNCQGIAKQNWNELKTIGLIDFQKNEQTFTSTSIYFTMVHISTKMDV